MDVPNTIEFRRWLDNTKPWTNIGSMPGLQLPAIYLADFGLKEKHMIYRKNFEQRTKMELAC